MKEKKTSEMKSNVISGMSSTVGAAAGVAAWALMIGAVITGEKKLEEYKTKVE